MKHRSKLFKIIFSLITITFATASVLFISQTLIYAAEEHVWTITLGSSGLDMGHSFAVDSSGNIYLTGQFNETVDFDPGPDTDYHTAAPHNNAYLTRFNSDGTYVWTKVIHSTDSSLGNGVVVDSSGNIYFTGDFEGTADFDPGDGVDSRIASSGIDNMGDIFLTKINADGSYAWTKTIGGPGDDQSYRVALDSSGNIYIAGRFSGTVDFDPDGLGDSHSSTGSVDVFLTKINLDGSYGWTKTLPGAIDPPFETISIALDSNNNIYIAGYFTNTGDFDPGPGVDNHTSAGQGDMFLTRINFDGSYGWTKTFGGSSDDGKFSSVAVDSSDNVYVVSNFSGTADFDPDPVATDFYTSAGQGDISITRINSDGSYGWTKIFSGPGDDGIFTAVAVDASDNVYVAGTFSNTVDFDPDTITTDLHTSAGLEDIFITKLNADESYGWTHTIGGAGTDYAFCVKTDSFGSIYVTGAVDWDILLTKLIEQGDIISTLSVTVPNVVTEGDDILVDQGIVGISRIHSTDLSIDLTSSDTTEVTLSATAVIPQGSTSANFDLTIVDDSVYDGTQVALVTVSAAGWASATDVIDVEDNEQQVLTLSIPDSAMEGDGTAQGIVSVPGTVISDLVITLSSDDIIEVTVPSWVTIAAGQSSTSFDLTIIDDIEIDGTQMVNISAFAAGWTPDTESIDIEDNEQKALSLSIPSSAMEGDDTVQCSVSIPGTFGSDLVVVLSSSDTSEVTVPATVTITAGQTSANFDLIVVDDGTFDGTQIVTITASAVDWTSADDTIDIRDIEDTDGDNMPDWWETQYFGDLSQDGGGDYDGDGVSNLDEYNSGGHPNNHEPETPGLELPLDGSIGVDLAPTLETNAFSDFDGHNHATTEWQISTQQDDFSDDMLVFKAESDIALTSLTVPSYILDENTTYYWRARFLDGGDAASEWAVPFEFTTGASSVTDTNANGIPDSQDLGANESELDLDDNGTFDVNESSDTWKCLNTEAGDGHVGVKVPPGNILNAVESVDPASISDTVNRPDLLPHTFVNFSVTVPNVGGSVDITVYLSGTLPANTHWYTWNAATGWQQIPAIFTQTSSGDTKVEFTKTDGGTGDADGLADGVIIDPSGPGAAAAPQTAPPGGGGGGGGGCFIATAAFGSAIEPQVQLLREFRDQYLLTNSVGSSFVRLYYTYSPPMADFISNHDGVRNAVRWSLLPLVGVSWFSLKIGPVATVVLLLSFMFLISATTLVFYRKMRLRKQTS